MTDILTGLSLVEFCLIVEIIEYTFKFLMVGINVYSFNCAFSPSNKNMFPVPI